MTSKCAVMRCTSFNASYSLCGSILSVVHKHLYLGVTLDDHLPWSTHITNITNKATKMLNFIQRHSLVSALQTSRQLPTCS